MPTQPQTSSTTPQRKVPARPGKRQGPVTELTTIFNVKKGHEKPLRELLESFGKRTLAERQVSGLRIGTLHEMRWVLFDNDTRMMFCTSYDGEWDPYIEDFARESQQIFDAIFIHAEGYPEAGIRDPGAKDYIVSNQVTAADYTRFYDATIKDVRKALELQKSFQKLLDTPEFREALNKPELKALLGTPAFKAVLDHAAS